MFKSLPGALIGAMAILQLGMPVPGVQAGPVWDWLLGRPIYTYPATTTANYAPAYAAAPAATTANYAPAYAAAPAAVAPAATVPAAVAPVATVPVAVAPVAVAPATAVPASGPLYAKSYLPLVSPRAVAYGPVTQATAAPVTTSYAPAAPCATCAPATTAYAPVTAYYPSATPAAVVAPAPALVVQPVQPAPAVVRYMPNYRTSWFRVPITYYRPVTVYQGVVAQPAPVMQPCNTYGYQVQRVRTPWLFRPWLPAPAATPVQYGTPAVAQPVVIQSGATVSPQGLSPGVSYEASPGVPGSLPGSTIPSYPPASSMPTAPGLPADQPPTLPMGTPPSSAMIPVPSSAPASTSNNGRVSPGAANSVYQVKPIPLPDVKVDKPSGRPVAPPLLNTADRERTAHQTSAVRSVVTSAVWTTPATPTTAPSRSSDKPPVAPSLWNDSGWRTARD